MRIGFYIQWPIGSLNAVGTNVLGDELICNSLVKYLNKISGVSAELFAPNHLPCEFLDFMIYVNETPPNRKWADKHVLYMQNAYPQGGEKALGQLQQYQFDGYVFYSNKLLNFHMQSGREGIYLPFGVDIKEFYPRTPSVKYEFECAYIGNDIKGKERTELYLCPATQFNFGLFGNWTKPKFRIKKWIRQLSGGTRHYEKYKKKFSKISQGRISQEDVPILYSSSKINLNCTAQDCVVMDVITLRIFEVLACKGFLITDRTPIAEKLLKDCVVFTDGGRDLTEKIKYYLAHPEERVRIAENGYNYVLKNASIEAKAKKLYDYIVKLQPVSR